MSAPTCSQLGYNPINYLSYGINQTRKFVAEVIFPTARTLFFTGCYASIALSITAITVEVFFQLTSSLFLLGVLSLSAYGLLSIQAKMENTTIDKLALQIGNHVGSVFKYLHDSLFGVKE